MSHPRQEALSPKVIWGAGPPDPSRWVLRLDSGAGGSAGTALAGARARWLFLLDPSPPLGLCRLLLLDPSALVGLCRQDLDGLVALGVAHILFCP